MDKGAHYNLKTTANERINLKALMNYASNLKGSADCFFRVAGKYELPSLMHYRFQG